MDGLGVRIVLLVAVLAFVALVAVALMQESRPMTIPDVDVSSHFRVLG